MKLLPVDLTSAKQLSFECYYNSHNKENKANLFQIGHCFIIGTCQCVEVCHLSLFSESSFNLLPFLGIFL